MQTLSELVKEARSQTWDTSEVSAATLKRAHAVHPVSAVQTEYSLWTRDVEKDVRQHAKIRHWLCAYSPLGRLFNWPL